MDCNKSFDYKDDFLFSTNYIDWLRDFTDKNGSFSTETINSQSDKLTLYDIVQAQRLVSFYEMIDEYAHETYVSPTIVEDGMFYSIQFQGNGYFIGFDYSGDGSFYCTRLDEAEEDAIDYSFVLSGVKLSSAISIDDRLDELAEKIEQLSKDIPIAAIEKATAEGIHKVRVKKYGERD